MSGGVGPHQLESISLLAEGPQRKVWTLNVGITVDDVIKVVSNDIGLGWKFLARNLGFSNTDVDAIEYRDQINLKEQIFQFFHQWEQREGNSASASKLINALEEEGGFDNILLILQKQNICRHAPFTSTRSSQPVPSLCILTPSNLDSDVSPDSTINDSPRSNSKVAVGASNEAMGDREIMIRKRIEKFAVNKSNQSSSLEASDQSKNHQGPLEAASNSAGNASSYSTVFEINDWIEVKRIDAAPWYGVVKWLGELPECHGKSIAGVEMETEVPGGCSGSREGVKYFTCVENHGLFLPTENLQKDHRFANLDMSNDLCTTSEVTSQETNVSSPQNVDLLLSGSPLKSLFDHLNLRESPSSRTNQQSACNETSTKVLVFTVPVDRVGFLIGSKGKNILEVERLTNTIIKVNPNCGISSGNAKGIIYGSEENQKKAIMMILDRLKDRELQHTAKTETMDIPNDKVGKIIGKGGQTVSAIKSLSRVLDIKFDKKPDGLDAFLCLSRKCMITGSEENIEEAKRLIHLAMDGVDIVSNATIVAVIGRLAEALGVQIDNEEV